MSVVMILRSSFAPTCLSSHLISERVDDLIAGGLESKGHVFKLQYSSRVEWIPLRLCHLPGKEKAEQHESLYTVNCHQADIWGNG